jgi:signal transduction histidine kinase
MPRPTRSISLPIVLASISVPLSVALLVGWVLLLLRSESLVYNSSNILFLLIGALAFSMIIATLVLFSVFLVREILEVRRQNSFIDSVTHELKSPLASLKLCLETSARAELSHEQREDLRSMMLADLDRLSVFVDDVLEASRLAHGQGGYAVSEINLRELAERCALPAAQRHKLPPENVRIDIPEELNLHTERTALETILKNLLDNAIKYSDPPAKVEVRAARRADSSVEIEVRDHGIGLQRQHLKRVFQRFYRVPSERVRARRGTGLGLFVVSALARHLGGSLSAHSDGLGTGSTFRLVLPRRTAERLRTAE